MSDMEIHEDKEEITREIKGRLESSDLEEILERIDLLIEDEKEIKPHMVGLKIALVIADELKNGKQLGSESGNVILKYKEFLTENELEEAIAYARQFITKPEDLSTKLAEKLFPGKEDLAEGNVHG